MSDQVSPKPVARRAACAGMALVMVMGAGSGRPAAAPQRGQAPAPPGGQRGQAPPSPRAGAPVDLTGYWVSIVTEDWRYRMLTPPKGDYQSVPLNNAGRRLADTWEPSQDGACDAYGAAALLRMPGRLHITWQDDTTLQIETDAGQQTRLLRFGAAPPPSGERQRQGYSVAEWGRPPGPPGGGFGGPGGGAGAGGPGTARRWAPLNVATTQLRAGWLRKNGVPYSENAVMREHFIRFAEGSDEWLTVTTVIEDPTYLTQSFITSSNFKREADGSKFKPAPCKGS